MQKNSLKFDPGDIAVLELPFTNLIGRKLRPVLVLSNDNLNKKSRDVIVAKISSKKQIPEYEVSIDQQDLKEGRIKKTSYIHCHSIFTVEKSLIVKKVGKLRNEKLKEVKSTIKEVFGLINS